MDSLEYPSQQTDEHIADEIYAIPNHWKTATTMQIFHEIEEELFKTNTTTQIIQPLNKMHNACIIKFFDFFIDGKNNHRELFRECTATFISKYINHITIPNGISYYWLHSLQNFNKSVYADEFPIKPYKKWIEINKTCNDAFIKLIWLKYVNLQNNFAMIEMLTNPFYVKLCEKIKQLMKITKRGYNQKTHLTQTRKCWQWFYYRNTCYKQKTGCMESEYNRSIWDCFKKSKYYKFIKRCYGCIIKTLKNNCLGQIIAGKFLKKNSTQIGELTDEDFYDFCKILCEDD